MGLNVYVFFVFYNYYRFVLPAKAFGWKVDIFGTPDEEGLPKVLIA